MGPSLAILKKCWEFSKFLVPNTSNNISHTNRGWCGCVVGVMGWCVCVLLLWRGGVCGCSVVVFVVAWCLPWCCDVEVFVVVVVWWRGVVVWRGGQPQPQQHAPPHHNHTNHTNQHVTIPPQPHHTTTPKLCLLYFLSILLKFNLNTTHYFELKFNLNII